MLELYRARSTIALSTCSKCGFEEREGDTHRVVTIVRGSAEDPHEIAYTCTISRENYTARFGKVETLKAEDCIYFSPVDGGNEGDGA
jgi:hypothetical protein